MISENCSSLFICTATCRARRASYAILVRIRSKKNGQWLTDWRSDATEIGLTQLKNVSLVRLTATNNHENSLLRPVQQMILFSLVIIFLVISIVIPLLFLFLLLSFPQLPLLSLFLRFSFSWSFWIFPIKTSWYPKVSENSWNQIIIFLLAVNLKYVQKYFFLIRLYLLLYFYFCRKLIWSILSIS